MSLVKVSGNASGTGIFTIASPNSNTDRTLTLPDNTGTILTTATAGVPINGPAFSAYQSVAQTLTSATFTKITVTTEEFDTNNNFSSSRFTPTVAGYYQFSANISVASSATTIFSYFYKNGTYEKSAGGSGSTQGAASGSALIYCNGSTDYIEFYAYFAVGQNTNPGIAFTYFQGYLARSAT